MADARLIVSEETTEVSYSGVRELVFGDGLTTSERGGKIHIAGGGSSANVVSTIKVAGAVLSGHRAVKLSGGLALYASNLDNPSAESVLGITTNSAIIGGNVNVVISGEIQEGSWSWTQLLPIYLSTNGQLTQVAPTSGGIVELGIALTSDTILVRIQKASFLI